MPRHGQRFLVQGFLDIAAAERPLKFLVAFRKNDKAQVILNEPAESAHRRRKIHDPRRNEKSAVGVRFKVHIKAGEIDVLHRMQDALIFVQRTVGLFQLVLRRDALGDLCGGVPDQKHDRMQRSIRVHPFRHSGRQQPLFPYILINAGEELFSTKPLLQGGKIVEVPADLPIRRGNILFCQVLHARGGVLCFVQFRLDLRLRLKDIEMIGVEVCAAL